VKANIAIDEAESDIIQCSYHAIFGNNLFWLISYMLVVYKDAKCLETYEEC